MIATKLVDFDGCQMRVPADGFTFPCSTFKGFPTCCGAGKVGDYFVPDVIGVPPLRVSPACCIHDWTWMFWEKTPANFRQSNRLFLENLWLINDYRGGNVVFKFQRMPLIWAYYIVVSSPVGMANFYTNDYIMGA